MVGRLKPGQPARLRLAGFPWTQYGVVPARVGDVGTEPQDGLIRGELRLEPRPTSVIPLEHGLTAIPVVDAADRRTEDVGDRLDFDRAQGRCLSCHRCYELSAAGIALVVDRRGIPEP